MTRSKHVLLEQQIESAIKRGVLSVGDALPSEAELARKYGVSRGTVRRALADLSRKRLIKTENGIGSHVIFHNQEIRDELRWGKALSTSGFDLSVELLNLTTIEDSRLAEKLKVDSPLFIAVDRRRLLPTGTVVSLERSRLDARRFPELVNEGLKDGSLSQTISDAGLTVASGQETLRVVALKEQDTHYLTRPAGSTYLYTEKISYDSSGGLVEYVESYLDPDHFEYKTKF